MKMVPIVLLGSFNPKIVNKPNAVKMMTVDDMATAIVLFIFSWSASPALKRQRNKHKGEEFTSQGFARVARDGIRPQDSRENAQSRLNGLKPQLQFWICDTTIVPYF